MLFLSSADVLRIADRALGDFQVRDAGLIESAVARPRTMVNGEWAYRDAASMAAALTQSIVGNHCLIDGNKRLGLACLLTFLRMNGWRLTMTNEEAYVFIYAVASGDLRDIPEISRRIADAMVATTR